jgi:hypothetical protein
VLDRALRAHIYNRLKSGGGGGVAPCRDYALFTVRRNANPTNPAAVWQAMTGEPILEYWRITRDYYYLELEEEQRQLLPKT